MCLIDYYSQNKNKSLLMIHGLFFLITVCCFSYFDYLLLCDYPNHLTKVHLYNHLSDSHAVLSEYYYKNDSIAPYIIFNKIVGFLEPITGIYWAGKIFIIFALFVILSGGLFLNYTLYNRITSFSLFIHIFMFNTTLLLGFMNFVLGLGLALWGYGLWIRFYNNTYKFYGLFGLYGIIIFYTHVFAFFILGLVIGLYQLSQSPKSTLTEFLKSSFYASLKVLTFSIIPIFLSIFINSKDNTFPSFMTYYPDLSTNLLLTYISPLLFEVDNQIPAVIMVTLFMALIVLRKIEFKQPFVLFLLFIIGLCVPYYVAGVACVNYRIPSFLGVLFCVSASFDNKEKYIKFCAGLMGILCIGLYVHNMQMIKTHSEFVSEFVATIKHDKNLYGKKLITVNDGEELHFHNISNYAVIEARMLDPILFTHIPNISMYKKYTKIYGCQERTVFSRDLRLSQEQAIDKHNNYTPTPEELVCQHKLFWWHWRTDFDYVFWIHSDKKPKDVPSELSLYKSGSFFTIYKINKIGKS